MKSEEHLLQTPVYNKHLDLKARMVGFGGWNMPVQYNGILAEYEHTRTKASLFDISHMGEFIIKGDYKQSGLDRLVTMKLSDLPVKSCRYGMLLNEAGGVIDDLIVFRMEEDKWFIVVNAATKEKDLEHFRRRLSDEVDFVDVSDKTGKLDIQGPLSRQILKKFIPEIEKLNYYTFENFDLLNERALVSRTGYTGELGFEIYFPWEKTAVLWDELLKCNDLKPAGLGARDVLRLEVGYSLYGHELNDQRNALESGLGKFIDFDKDFIGKEALLKVKEAGPINKIAGFISDSRRSPRADQPILDKDLKDIGIVTSGTFSPSLNKGIGLGLIKSDCCFVGQEVLIGNEKNGLKGKIHSRIFYKNGSLKN